MASGAATTEFPVAHCNVCDKDVLCYYEVDESDRELVRCLGCSTPADPPSVRWLDLHDIEALGYGFVMPEGGCGLPGCGRGRCGRAEPPFDDPFDDH